MPYEAADDAPQGFRVLSSGAIDRYEVLWGIRVQRYRGTDFMRPVLPEGEAKDRKEQYRLSRVLVACMSRHLEAFPDMRGEYAGVVSVIQVFAEGCQEVLFLSAWLNSHLASWVMSVLFDPLRLSGQMCVTKNTLGAIPLRRIHYTTPPQERTALVVELRGMYEAGSFASILAQTEQLLPKDPQGNFLAFNPGATGAEEQSDVVHDFLAFLAEEMIDLNKEKHKEIDRFLTWLQDELGFDVEDFTGKTFVKAYYEHDWDELLRRLQQNKRRCTNPVDGLFVGNIRVEYEASVEKLHPIQEALQKTDWLIDQIVYKLYGLTDEEIAIVEESFDG